MSRSKSLPPVGTKTTKDQAHNRLRGAVERRLKSGKQPYPDMKERVY